MKEIPEVLSIQELKALCEFFFNEGCKRTEDFEITFDKLMLGKYNKVIEEEALKIKWNEMQASIQKEMDKWDEDQRGKAGKVLEDMRKIFITS